MPPDWAGSRVFSVDYYGSPTPLQQIAAIASPDPRQLVITPWDGTWLKWILMR